MMIISTFFYIWPHLFQLRPVSVQDFLSAMSTIRPSTNMDHMKKLEDFAKKFGEISVKELRNEKYLWLYMILQRSTIIERDLLSSTNKVLTYYFFRAYHFVRKQNLRLIKTV